MGLPKVTVDDGQEWRIAVNDGIAMVYDNGNRQYATRIHTVVIYNSVGKRLLPVTGNSNQH